MDNNKKNKILFLVNGLGMGNSTRCYSIIERLAENGMEIDVMTSANGLFFFSDKKEINRIIKINEFYYAKEKSGKLNVLRTILSLFDFIRIYVANNRLVKKYLKEERPSAVVIDSQYIFWPMISQKIPIIALNNSDIVVKSFFKMKNKPLSIAPQFFLIEFMDYLFHLLVPTKVISPVLGKFGSENRKFIHVPSIARKNCKREIHKENIKNVVIMLSGSAFGSQVNLEGESFPFHIDVIGRTGKSSGKVTFHGKILDNMDIIKRADVLVVNAGFSAVSEGVYMGKPMAVIPIENHAEQYINAKTVEELGLGIITKAEEIPSAIREVISNIGSFRSSHKSYPFAGDGSEKACRVITDIVNSQSR
jgi:UDP:flavonoid glycosyltransferase YjiC (YdhE family)|tara:strand:+ start:1768 stop:2856 length:1089 start_codon:yes stop_codon:yes gene_type:complete